MAGYVDPYWRASVSSGAASGPDSIGAVELIDSSVGIADLAPAVLAKLLAPNTVTTAEIADQTVVQADLSAALIDRLTPKPSTVTPSDGQTSFSLASAPTLPSTLKMYVNGAAYRVIDPTNAIALSGSTVSFNPANAGFGIKASDIVSFDYV